MKIFKQVLNFYVNSSIHVALAVYSLAWVSLIEFDVSYDETVLCFIFYASITGYNFVKYFGIAKFHHRRLAIWLKWIQVLSFICFCFMCFYAFKLQIKTLLWIAVFGVITFFYAMPFLPIKPFEGFYQNLRNIGGLKVYIIALSWAGVTVFLPLIDNDYSISADVMLVALQRFLFILVLMLPFEIRDLQYDGLELATIPQKIGIKKTKVLGGVILIFIAGLEFLKDAILLSETMVMLLVLVVTFVFVLFSKKNQRSYYSAFWVEAIPILWLILLLLFV
jgi:hypothetical protein